MEKSKKKFFSLDEVSKLMKQGEELKDAGPETKQKALEMARYKLTPNEGLEDFKTKIIGKNPLDNDIIKVPGGTGGFIEDRSMVKGKIPVDSSSFMVPGGRSGSIVGSVGGVTDRLRSPELMKEITGTEFTSKIDALKKLAGPGKKMLGMIGGPAAGLATALSSGDVMAAAPIPGLESTEAGAGSDTQMASEMDRPGEGGYMSPERRKRLFNMLQDR